RFDFDNTSVNVLENSKNRLEQINGKVILKRKRISKELLTNGNSTKKTPVSQQKLKDNYNSDISKNKEKEKTSLLQAFPCFHQQKLTPEEISSSKMLGIPDWLANPTIINSSSVYSIDDNNSLGLSERLINHCKSLGITEFFAVQASVIPLLLRNKNLYDLHKSFGDICVSAPTGSGKTLTYVLTIIEVSLIVLPTKDLAMQVKETFEAFCKNTNLKIGVITGQHSFAHEQEQIVGNSKEILIGGNSKVDILIATPGRLIEHIMNSSNFTLQHLRFLVIDEADRLLNQSYNNWLTFVLKSKNNLKNLNINKVNEVDKIKELNDSVSMSIFEDVFSIPKSTITEKKTSPMQKLLFSATLTRNPEKIANLHLINPKYISIMSIEENETGLNKYSLPKNLNEYMIITFSSLKPLIVIHLINNQKISSALCFTKSVDSAHRLNKLIELFQEIYLNENNKKISSNIISKEYSNLISRGIDIDCVDTVINYDVPIYMKKYIHRVGRTARAGRQGDAYSLVETHEVFRHLKNVKKFDIKSTALDPMMTAYQKALDLFKEYMSSYKLSVTNYHRTMTSNSINNI
ncbi:11385_t:CDS:10, partial [Entrophospora sp. SA101]